MAGKKKRTGEPAGPAGGRSDPQEAVGPAGEFDPLAIDGAARGGGPREDAPPSGEPAGAPEVEARLADLEAELEAARAEAAEARDRFLRAAAELDNVRKRARREVEEAHLYGQAGLLRDLLEVRDNLDLALRAGGPAGEVTGDLESLRAGVALIRQRLDEVMARQGIEEISALGEPFDPARHEAVREVEIEGVPSGQVTEVVQAGYRLRDRVLRPSRVIVAR